MKYFQVIFGYAIMYSLLDIIFFHTYTLHLFLIYIIFVKVIPHPNSIRNPFAFGLRLRMRQ